MKNDLMQQINDLLEDFEVEFDGESFSEIDEMVQDRINEQEFIYYKRAMNYLIENDIDLTESLSLAHEMGYSAGDLNCETLATLLLQERMREDWYEVMDEVQELIEEWENEE